MVVFESLKEIGEAGMEVVGSKAMSLAQLAKQGFRVPAAICISTEFYEAYMTGTGLRDRVLFELGRKPFEEMRWEEIWDAALRIRNLFLCTPLPATMHERLHGAIARVFGDRPVVVRSSAPGEDSGEASFAGLHESFVNVRGAAEILKHVRLVWASLWSDAALLYRQELRLDVRRSRMAVIVQALAEGACSGVAFSRNPNRDDEVLIEAVYGLNAGLVDGTIEPDRWTVDRRTGRITSHTAAKRGHAMAAGPSGIERKALDPARSLVPPLADPEVGAVCALSIAAEKAFGAPQDVEWTRVSERADRPAVPSHHHASPERRHGQAGLVPQPEQEFREPEGATPAHRRRTDPRHATRRGGAGRRGPLRPGGRRARRGNQAPGGPLPQVARRLLGRLHSVRAWCAPVRAVLQRPASTPQSV